MSELTEKQIREYYAQSPIDHFEFEIVKIGAPWWSIYPYDQYNQLIKDAPAKDHIFFQYRNQNSIKFELDGKKEEAFFMPVTSVKSNSSLDLSLNRQFSIGNLNSQFSNQQDKFDPDKHDPQDLKIHIYTAINFGFDLEGPDVRIKNKPVILNVINMIRNSDLEMTLIVGKRPTDNLKQGKIQSNDIFKGQVTL